MHIACLGVILGCIVFDDGMNKLRLCGEGSLYLIIKSEALPILEIKNKSRESPTLLLIKSYFILTGSTRYVNLSLPSDGFITIGFIGLVS